MQSMANQYVRYFNVKHQQTGAIWEGRFRLCLVGSEPYLFVLYKYNEMSPIKAGMVTEYALFRGLASNLEQRCERYKEQLLS